MNQLNSQQNVFTGLQIMDSLKNYNQLTQSPTQGSNAQNESVLQMNSNYISRKNRRFCAVCNDRANGNYYGAVSCEGCKIFFRRSILNDTFRSYVCKGFGNECDILSDRNICKLCRFNRCKRVGMLDTSVSQFPRSRNRTENLRAEYFPQQSVQSLQSIQSTNSYSLPNFQTFGPNYYQNSSQTINSSETSMDSISKTVAINTTEDNNEETQISNIPNITNITNITEAFQKTLGRQPVVICDQQLLILQIEPNDKISDKYKPYQQEVIDFTRSLDIFSSIPQNEMELNLHNWLDVLLIRSCWWFANKNPEDKEQILRVSEKYGLHREHNKLLEPIFSFAETVKDMKMTEIELSLTITYILLCGHFSFDCEPYVEKTETSKRQEEVLKLLSNYQKTTFPEDEIRFMGLLINLSELAYIAGTS